MKIALIGYGKMGKAIEQVAQERGHEIVVRIDSGSKSLFESEDFRNADVAIEFTNPEAAPANVRVALAAGVPVVCGSTGWNAGIQDAETYCGEKGGALLVSSNFSVGVQLFFALNRHLAQLMAGRPEYKIALEETHHTAKKDAPSGTAVTLAEGILAARADYTSWHLGAGERTHSLPVNALREEAVPGTHMVTYASAIDEIQITHTAHSRAGFALGAVLAAEFLVGKRGVFSMEDVLQLGVF
jgi:4-hydroxy-tetrahydrodipicolinate reductase